MPKVVSSPIFVGRGAELATVDEAVARAEDGSAAVLLVGGEAGVGKTRLAEEVRDRVAARGGLVMHGGCVEMGGEGLPLAPVVEALRRLIRQLGAGEVDRLLGGRRAELGRLLPELVDGPAAPMAAGGGVDGSQGPAIGRLYDLVLGLLERLSENRPVLLVIEDLHWADRSTRDLVGFLARSLRMCGVVLLMTYRSDEAARGHPLRPFLAELERLRTVERLDLRGFVRAEVAEQIAAITGETPAPEMVDRVHRRSEGNAFFVEELVAATEAGYLDGLSPTLRDVLVAKVEGLPIRTQDLLRVAAAGGRRVAHRLLAVVSGLSDHELWEVLRPAVSANVLTTDSDDEHYVFRHALVREVLHEEALPGEHTALHRRYAEAVDTAPGLGGSGARAAAAAAYHWTSAHNLPKALSALVAAARAAANSYAYAEAHQHLEHALELWDQVPDAVELTGMDHVAVLMLAASTARVAGEWHRGYQLIAAARTEVSTLGDPVRHGLVLIEHSRLARSLALTDGLAELEEAVQLIPSKPASHDRALVLAELGKALTLVPRLKEADEVLDEALDLAAKVGSREAEAIGLVARACAHNGGLGNPKMTRQAREIAQTLGDDQFVALTYVSESDAGLGLARYEDAVASGREGMRLARRIGLARTTGVILGGNVAEALLKLGRWEESAALIEENMDLDPSGIHILFLASLRAQLMIGSGRLDDAQRELDTAKDVIARRFVGAQFTLPLTYLDALLDIARGRPEGVPDRALDALTPFDLDSVARYAAPLLAAAMSAAADMAERARAARDEDAAREARIAAGRLETTAGGLPPDGVGELPAWVALLRAEHTRCQGAADPAAWAAAGAAWEGIGRQFEHAYVAYRHAEALLEVRDRDAAADAARRAYEIATGLGAPTLARDIDLLARRGRLTLTPAAGSGRGSGEYADSGGDTAGTAPSDDPLTLLTARELEVLRHIMAGRTNPQIASALFISTKTASTHVSNILGKLGVTSRGQAAAVAHQLRLVDLLADDSGPTDAVDAARGA